MEWEGRGGEGANKQTRQGLLRCQEPFSEAFREKYSQEIKDNDSPT